MARTSVPKICSTSATRGGPNLLRITSPPLPVQQHPLSYFPPPALSTVVCFLHLPPLLLASFLLLFLLLLIVLYLDNCAIFSTFSLYYFFPLFAFLNFNFIQFFLHLYFSFFLGSFISFLFLLCFFFEIYRYNFILLSLFLSSINCLENCEFTLLSIFAIITFNLLLDV